MFTYVSLPFNRAQFMKICMRPWFRVDCFLKTVHVHCVNPELCCTNLTSHWYAVIVETTPKPKTFSSLLLQVNPRNWIQQNLTQSNPKRHYILMHRFWWISQTQGARREGFNAQCPSIPFDLNKTSLRAITCQLPPAQSLTAALWLQRGQLMHFVSTTGRRAVRCARAYVQFLVRRSVLVSCYCEAVQNSAQHISITIL